MTEQQARALNYAIFNLGQQAELAREAGRDRLAEDLERYMLDLESLRHELATKRPNPDAALLDSMKRIAQIGGNVDVRG